MEDQKTVALRFNMFDAVTCVIDGVNAVKSSTGVMKQHSYHVYVKIPKEDRPNFTIREGTKINFLFGEHVHCTTTGENSSAAVNGAAAETQNNITGTMYTMFVSHAQQSFELCGETMQQKGCMYWGGLPVDLRYRPHPMVGAVYIKTRDPQGKQEEGQETGTPIKFIFTSKDATPAEVKSILSIDSGDDEY
eukprot:TRINITY_DN113835_c0_g1_i1.p1 TRINITY_DN113835_c0_g1~~TRINITY_DN113835_c0_g1_i1.p1  ORF type:complete len:191 (+),score=23.53 TRINITY_DN113835_c0_g1_i1:94-666(+)